MDLYFAPLACSMASRITLYEAGAEAQARFIKVDPRTKRLVADGTDYRAVNPMGQVPALRLEDGRVLTENAAILHHLAERFPAAALLPDDRAGLDRLRQWLSFIAAELHAAVFHTLFDPSSPDAARDHARDKLGPRLLRMAAQLEGREWVLDSGFSVADAYLATVLNWCPAAGIDLGEHPVLRDWHRRALQRPSIARAVAEERALHAEQEARRPAA